MGLLPSIFFTFALLQSITASDGSGDKVHYKQCPEDWIQKGGRCYKVMGSTTFEEALTRCKGHLPVVVNDEDKQNIRAISRGNPAWLGLYKRSRSWIWISSPFNNKTADLTGFSWMSVSDDTPSKRCVVLSGYGHGHSEQCEKSVTAVCVKSAGCDDGWFGVNCSYKCNCLNDNCENSLLLECADGCVKGWKGKLCNIPKDQSAVSVSYYCFKGQNNFTAYMLLDQNDRNFSSITALDSEGRLSPGCTKESFKRQGFGDKLYININTDGSSFFDPPCPATKIEEGPKMHWTFRLQKSTGISTVFDEDIHMTCDFSTAEPLTVENPTINTDEITLVTLKRSRISAEIYPATYTNLTRLDTTKMWPGQSLVLVAAPITATGQNIKSLYPVLCQANSPDGKVVKKLTDETGCGISDTEFDMFRVRETESGPLYVSGRFLAFTFPGYDSVEFNCDFRPGTSVTCQDNM